MAKVKLLVLVLGQTFGKSYLTMKPLGDVTCNALKLLVLFRTSRAFEDLFKGGVFLLNKIYRDRSLRWEGTSGGGGKA